MPHQKTFEINKNWLFIFLLFSIISCENKDSKNSFKEEDFKIRIDKPEFGYINEETCINISCDNPELHIVHAYMDCKFDSLKEIDYKTRTIKGCDMNLFVLHDTVMIGYKALEEKEYFHSVLLLFSKGQELFVKDTSFKVKAIKR